MFRSNWGNRWPFEWLSFIVTEQESGRAALDPSTCRCVSVGSVMCRCVHVCLKGTYQMQSILTLLNPWHHCLSCSIPVREQECAAGFYRLRVGWLASAPAARVPTAAGMGGCVQCQCSGHSSTCDPETSICQVPVCAFTCLCVLDECQPCN